MQPLCPVASEEPRAATWRQRTRRRGRQKASFLQVNHCNSDLEYALYDRVIWSCFPSSLNVNQQLFRNVSWEDLLMRRVPPPFVPTIVSSCSSRLDYNLFTFTLNMFILFTLSRLVWRTCPISTRSSPLRSQSWRLPRRPESWLLMSSYSSRTSPTWLTGAREEEKQW